MIAWLFGWPSSLGSVSPWNPVIADRYAAGTERMLLGAAGPVHREGEAQAKRRQFLETHYQFWQQVEQGE